MNVERKIQQWMYCINVKEQFDGRSMTKSDGLASRPGGVEILLAASCYRNRGKAPAMIQ